MKSILSFFLAAFICSTAFAQTASYETVFDDPSEMRKLQISINAIMANVFADEGANQGHSSFGYGFNVGYFPLKNRIGLELNYQTGTDISSGLDSYGKTEFRGTFALISSRKTKEKRMVLDETNRTVTSAMVPRTTQNNLEGRFSFVRNKGLLGNVDLTTQGSWNALYSNSAIGLGLQWRQNHAIKILVDDSYYAKSSSHFLLYGDVLLGMGTSWDGKETSGSIGAGPSEDELEDAIDQADLASGLGGRLGMKYFMWPAKTIGFSFSTEVGYIPPNTGLFFMMSMGLTINML